ncbi:MAG: monovalent cation/H+ antiporter subunit D family protein [Myxococcota bacterium]|jgi:multicomponent Na+:H+ antiporter subunit D|nr:monovalent cation/H+ antiporter subunit D family protein [Myxococcota bacterium]
MLPLCGAVLVAVTGRNANLRDAMTVVTSLVTFAVVASIAPQVMDGARPSAEVLQVLPGVSLAFRIEPLGMLFGLVASSLWIVTSIYAFGYMRGHHEANQTRFFVCFAIAISAALGIAFSANLFTLFLFYEAMTFSTYPLVTHHGTPEAKRAGRVYLGILVTTSVAFLLFAVLWTYSLVGHLEFRSGGILSGHIEGTALAILLGLFAFGLGKAALMPFHRWLPAAMVAPTPVSALLHAVAVVKAGVFSMVKILVYVFGIDFLHDSGASVWLMYLAAASILIASVRAIAMENLKARLAYSTISQLSYITLGAALATSSAVLGAGMHIAMHAVGKITLFFCAGAIYVAAHKSEISQLDGLGRRMPITFAAFFLGSLSIIGVPPTGGAWSKWYLALGAAEGHQLVFVFVLMLSSLLSIAYLMPIVVRGFFRPSPEGEEGGMQEASLAMVVPLSITAVGSVALFLFAPQLRELLLPVVGG